MTDQPNTNAKPKSAVAIVQRIYPDQRKALEQGHPVSLYTKQVPIVAFDFYPNQPPTGEQP